MKLSEGKGFNMPEMAWLSLTQSEKTLLLNALKTLRRSRPDETKDIDGLTIKLVHSAPHPEITVGVHGGQVQWTLGNPFPIRVCDYDAPSDEDLPDIDERGQRCRMWWEPADGKVIGAP
jgi:hypothetical protein